MANPSTRSELRSYCLRKLGAPVLEINVDSDQVEDAIDEGIQYYQTFNAEATRREFYKHQITDSDVSNSYIPVPDRIKYVERMLPASQVFGSNGNFFDYRYQLHLNDLWDLNGMHSGIDYYVHTKQYLNTLDTVLDGFPQVSFVKHENRLYIHGEFESQDLKSGQYVVLEATTVIDPDSYSDVYNDIWLKKYVTALIKRQWGSNLLKFEGMQLPGGVVLNGRQTYEDASTDIEKLEEEIRETYEQPIGMFVG